jgi:hypothetical protein
MAQSSESPANRGIRASQEFQKSNGDVANYRYIGNESTAGDRSCAGKKSPTTHRENIEGRTQAKPSYINYPHTRSHIDLLNRVRPNKSKRATEQTARPPQIRTETPQISTQRPRAVCSCLNEYITALFSAYACVRACVCARVYRICKWKKPKKTNKS